MRELIPLQADKEKVCIREEPEPGERDPALLFTSFTCT